MHITQFAHLSGTAVNFKSGDPIIGNCAHLEQTLYISVVSGQLEGHFQQRMVRNPVGQMEPLSPEIQMNEDGKVETIYSSPLEIQTFQAGSLIEIRPGCAYALKALTDGQFIEYLIPNSMGQALFKDRVGLISEQPLPDAISFELLKSSEVQVVLPDPDLPKEETPIVSPNTVSIPSMISTEAESRLTNCEINQAPSPEPLPQKYFYREEGTGLLMAMLAGFGLLVLFAFLLNTHNPLMFLFLLVVFLYVGYWTALLAIQLYKKPFSLGIEDDGLIVNNLTFNGLFIKWEDIDRIQMGAISHGRYDVQGELIIEIIPKNPDDFGKYLNPLSRFWFNYCATHNTDYTMPTITIGQTSVTIDLNELLPQLITKKLSYNYSKIAPQENA